MKGKKEALARAIRETMWDDETGFYYHVARETHRMELDGKSLKRKEIIGFLPLWAGALRPKPKRKDWSAT